MVQQKLHEYYKKSEYFKFNTGDIVIHITEIILISSST